eukprot:873579-Rhodomonas_salina.1
MLHPRASKAEEFLVEHHDEDTRRSKYSSLASAATTMVPVSPSATITLESGPAATPSENESANSFDRDLDVLARKHLPHLLGPTSPLEYFAVILGVESKDSALLATLSRDKQTLSALKCGIVAPYLDDEHEDTEAVSYTHLTLPTICSV